MIAADLVVRNLAEAATLRVGPVPRVGEAMRELGTVAEAAIAADQGTVVWVGADRALRRSVRLRRTARTIDAEGGTAVPGFVDAHTHLLFAGDRAPEVAQKVTGASYREIAEGGGGIYSTVRATRRASDAQLLDAAADRLRRMAATGTTSVEVKSGYALDRDGELRLLALVPRLARHTGLRLVPTYLGAHAVGPEFRGRPSEYVTRVVRATLPEVARRRLARFCDVFCEPGFFSVRDSERILRDAAALGLGTKIHADEFVRSGGARLAARLRVTSAEHLLATTAGDRAALAAAGVIAVLLPITGWTAVPPRRSPGREMVDAGVAVALGSDCSPNSWVEGMPVVLGAAVHTGRLTPAEALTAATVNAAAATGLADAGTIRVGAPADLAVFPIPSAERLGYRIDARPTLVLRQGKPVFPP